MGSCPDCTWLCQESSILFCYVLLRIDRPVACRVVRHQEGEAVGTVCLNLTKCPGRMAGSKSTAPSSVQAPGFSQALAAALRSLAKRCVELPLTMQGVSLSLSETFQMCEGDKEGQTDASAQQI